MNRRYRATNKTMRIVRNVTEFPRDIGPLIGDKGTGGRPCTKKTAVMLLERDDNSPGLLTTIQRETLEERAGDQYRKRDPFERRPSESSDEYVRRINKIMES